MALGVLLVEVDVSVDVEGSSEVLLSASDKLTNPHLMASPTSYSMGQKENPTNRKFCSFSLYQ